MLDVRCADCGQWYRLPDDMAGRRATCKACGAAVTLPDAPSGANRPTLASTRPAYEEFEEVEDDHADRFPPGPEPDVEVVAVLDEGDEIGPAPPPRRRPPGVKKPRPRVVAGLWARFAASLIDGIICTFLQIAYLVAAGGLLAGVIALFQGRAPSMEEWLLPFLVVYFSSPIVPMLYGAWMTSRGAHSTWGKQAMRMKVVDDDGNPLGFGQAFGREAGKFLSGLIIVGFSLALFNKERKTLHDMMSGTLVVEE